MTDEQLRDRVYEWSMTIFVMMIMLSAAAFCFALAFIAVRWAIS